MFLSAQSRSNPASSSPTAQPDYRKLTGRKTDVSADRRAERLTDGRAGLLYLSQAGLVVWLVNRLISFWFTH